MTCRTCAEEIRVILETSVAAVAIEHVNAVSVAAGHEPFDWANELEEEEREAAKEAARAMINILARKFGVEEL